MFNKENSEPYFHNTTVNLFSLNDLKDWDCSSKINFESVKDIKCYDLDKVAEEGCKQLGIRNLASPDALIIEPHSYIFVEFKEIDNLDYHDSKYTFVTDPNEKNKLLLKDLLFKHLISKITGAAIFCSITSVELHNQHYLAIFKENNKLNAKLILVVNDVKMATELTRAYHSLRKEIKSFGIQLEIASIDYFISDILPQLNPVH